MNCLYCYHIVANTVLDFEMGLGSLMKSLYLEARVINIQTIFLTLRSISILILILKEDDAVSYSKNCFTRIPDIDTHVIFSYLMTHPRKLNKVN